MELAAYLFKEWFRIWYHDHSYNTAAYHLQGWLAAANSSTIKEIIYVAKTVTYWKKEILNYFKYQVTTGFLEGMNNKIKTIKRMAYGFRTPSVLRTKNLINKRFLKT